MTEKEKIEQYIEEIKNNSTMYTSSLTEEEEEIIRKLLQNEWVQFIYESGLSVGYDSFEK